MADPRWEGRLGLTRRDHPGVPPGMYVEVERDVSLSGWHIWLTQRDPRDGPSEGWDVWAETEEHLQEWLGPDVLDVEWLTDALPDEVLAGLVGGAAAERRFRYVSPAGVAGWLHDADVASSAAELIGRAAVVPGLVESLWEPPTPRFRWSRLLRARVRLRARDRTCHRRAGRGSRGDRSGHRRRCAP